MSTSSIRIAIRQYRNQNREHIEVSKPATNRKLLIQAVVFKNSLETPTSRNLKSNRIYNRELYISEWTNTAVKTQVLYIIDHHFKCTHSETPTQETTNLPITIGDGYEIWDNCEKETISINFKPKIMYIGDIRETKQRAASIGKGILITDTDGDKELNMYITVHDNDHMILNVQYNNWTIHPKYIIKDKVLKQIDIDTLPDTFTLQERNPILNTTINFKKTIIDKSGLQEMKTIDNSSIKIDNATIANELNMVLKSKDKQLYDFKPYNQHVEIFIAKNTITPEQLPLYAEAYGLTDLCTHAFAVQFFIAKTLIHVVQTAFLHKSLFSDYINTETPTLTWVECKEEIYKHFPLESWCKTITIQNTDEADKKKEEVTTQSSEVKQLTEHFYSNKRDKLKFSDFEYIISKTINKWTNATLPMNKGEWNTKDPKQLVQIIKELIVVLGQLTTDSQTIVTNVVQAVHKAMHSSKVGGDYENTNYLKTNIKREMDRDELSKDERMNHYIYKTRHGMVHCTTNMTVGQKSGLGHKKEDCQEIKLYVDMRGITETKELQDLICLFTNSTVAEHPHFLDLKLKLGDRQMCMAVTVPEYKLPNYNTRSKKQSYGYNTRSKKQSYGYRIKSKKHLKW